MGLLRKSPPNAPKSPVRNMVTLRDLFNGQEAQRTTQVVDDRRIVIDTLILVVSIVALLANFFGQAMGWFRWVATAFAVIVIGWIAAQIFQRIRATWADYRERAALVETIRNLHGEFTDLLARFNRYADNTRSDTIPRLMIWLCIDEKVDLPIADTSLFHIWRLHGILQERVGPVAAAPIEFRSLVQLFGEVLELYHQLYVLKPYDRVRSMDITKLTPYAQTRVREDLAVQREDYNDFIRLCNSFGTRVNDAFEDKVFPEHLDRLKTIGG